ncbi:MAG: carbohydrate ABC transporter permease [Acidimicrobiia bacterium]
MNDELLPERGAMAWPNVAPRSTSPVRDAHTESLRRPKPRRFGRRVREALLGYALILPALVIFGFFVFWPFARNVYLGFFRTPLSGDGLGRYVGFAQYQKVLTSEQFLDSLIVTGKFWLLTVPASIILGLLLAVLGHRKLKGMGVYRTLFILSLATGAGVAGTIFFTLLNPVVGILRELPGFPDPAPLQNPTWALPSVAMFVVWLNISLAFIVLSAGLQNVPDDLYEAARIDGAGAIRRFFRITIPMLSPTLLFVFVVGSIVALIQSYPPIDATSKGGPTGATTTLPYLLVKTLRGVSPDQGKAAVLSVALFGVALVFTIVQLVFFEKRVTYGSGRDA